MFKNRKELSKIKKQESGAIMLEVIAVLSLMGLMGTMLFRQIYLRNQELSNIQMASEIRMVKEAFAAWIQANPQEFASCPTNGRCSALDLNDDSSALRDAINDYLPANYSGLIDDFLLYIQCNQVGGSKRCYGIVIPEEDSLPDDWNFKRAARVAVLTGMDGGVYDSDTGSSSLTNGHFVGSMGSWELDFGAGAPGYPTHVAITGMDMFQPEVVIDEVEVNLDRNLNLVMQTSQIYGRFVAGLNGCYEINHEFTSNGYVGGNDTIWDTSVPANVANCQPAFYVEGDTGGAGSHSATGNVHVLNDLTIGKDWTGADAGKSAMRFDKNGMIVFEKAEVEDPQDSNKTVNYILDPKYTSVMNDIKIMSRGGARLSDILPNYILKETQVVTCNDWNKNIDSSKLICKTGEISLPTCPENYKKAVVVTPVSFGTNFITADNYDVKNRNQLVIILKNGSSGNEIDQGAGFTDSQVSSGLIIRFSYENWKTGASEIAQPNAYTENLKAVVHKYCVFDATDFDWDGSFFAGNGTAPTANRPSSETDCSKLKTEGTCTMMGCTWSSSACHE